MQLNTHIFGDRLKAERERLNLSQQDAAHICGVRREMWGKYERGQVEPGAFVIEHLTTHGADPLYLFKGERSSASAKGISPQLVAAIVGELQKWQLLNKKTLSPASAEKAALALLDLVNGDENMVEVVAKTVLKLVA